MQASPVRTGLAPGSEWSPLQRLCMLPCAAPALWLAAAAWGGSLGANPLETLLRVSGRSAVLLLLLSLCVGPLLQLGRAGAALAQARFGRRLSDWNALIALRRPLGLWAFFYAALHTLLYVGLDAGLAAQIVLEDLAEHRHVLAGWAALLGLLPLALTSNAWARRVLGAWWQRLHLLAHAAAVAAVLHQALQAKMPSLLPWPELAVLALVLAWRLRMSWRGRREPLDEVRLRLRRWRGQGGPGG